MQIYGPLGDILLQSTIGGKNNVLDPGGRSHGLELTPASRGVKVWKKLGDLPNGDTQIRARNRLGTQSGLPSELVCFKCCLSFWGLFFSYSMISGSLGRNAACEADHL